MIYQSQPVTVTTDASGGGGSSQPLTVTYTKTATTIQASWQRPSSAEPIRAKMDFLDSGGAVIGGSGWVFLGSGSGDAFYQDSGYVLHLEQSALAPNTAYICQVTYEDGA